MTTAELHQQAERLSMLHEVQQHRVNTLAAEIAQLDGEAHLLTHVTATLDTLIELTTRESMGSVEALVTHGLHAVFADLPLTFRLQIDTKRGTQWVEPRLVSGAVDAPILGAFGGGPAAVVGFLLRLLVCRRLGLAPVLLLDEPFAFVARQYVEPLAKLLRELADAAGVTLVLVTHDPAYLAHATRAYTVAETPHGNTFTAVPDA